MKNPLKQAVSEDFGAGYEKDEFALLAVGAEPCYAINYFYNQCFAKQSHGFSYLLTFLFSLETTM